MDPKLTRFFAAISALAKLAGVVLVGRGVLSNDSPAIFWLQFVSGTVMILGPAIYDVWASGRDVLKSMAVGVQAGLNLAAAGKAIDENNNIVSHVGPGTTPLKQVTEETAKQIVQNFPPEAPIAKA